jgi:hypothetical protein
MGCEKCKLKLLLNLTWCLVFIIKHLLLLENRALMFLALDKLINQKESKKSDCGCSGAFYWVVLKQIWKRWLLPTSETTTITIFVRPVMMVARVKVKAFHTWIVREQLLICTPLYRFACDWTKQKFNNTLLAIDEFHHVSAIPITDWNY